MVNCCTAVIFIALTGIIHSIELYMCSTVCMYTHTYVPMMQSTQHYVKCNVSVVFMLNGVCTASDLHCAGCVCVWHIHEVSDVKDFQGNRLVSWDCLKCQRHRKPLHSLSSPTIPECAHHTGVCKWSTTLRNCVCCVIHCSPVGSPYLYCMYATILHQ